MVENTDAFLASKEIEASSSVSTYSGTPETFNVVNKSSHGRKRKIDDDSSIKTKNIKHTDSSRHSIGNALSSIVRLMSESVARNIETAELQKENLSLQKENLSALLSLNVKKLVEDAERNKKRMEDEFAERTRKMEEAFAAERQRILEERHL